MQKRERIIKSAMELFNTQGFHKTKIEEITKSAGIGKGTFYLYFKNKNELVFAAFEEFKTIINNTMEIAQVGLEENLSLKALFEKQAQVLTLELKSHQDLARFLLRDGASVSVEMYQEIKKFRKQLVDTTKETLEMAQAMEIINKLDTHISSIQIIGGILLTYETWLAGEIEIPDEAVHQNIVNYMLSAIQFNERKFQSLMQELQG